MGFLKLTGIFGIDQPQPLKREICQFDRRLTCPSGHSALRNGNALLLRCAETGSIAHRWILQFRSTDTTKYTIIRSDMPCNQLSTGRDVVFVIEKVTDHEGFSLRTFTGPGDTSFARTRAQEIARGGGVEVAHRRPASTGSRLDDAKLGRRFKKLVAQLKGVEYRRQVPRGLRRRRFVEIRGHLGDNALGLLLLLDFRHDLAAGQVVCLMR